MYWQSLSLSPSFWALVFSLSNHLTIITVIHRLLLLLGLLRALHCHTLPYWPPSLLHFITWILLKFTSILEELCWVWSQTNLMQLMTLSKLLTSLVKFLIYEMDKYSGFQVVDHVRIALRAYKKRKQSAGPSPDFLRQGLRICISNTGSRSGQSCLSRHHTLRTTDIMPLRWAILFVNYLVWCIHLMTLSLSSFTSSPHVLKTKEIDDKNELMTLNLNGTELNANNYLWARPFWGKPKKVFLW